jgi:hypothetical protein
LDIIGKDSPVIKSLNTGETWAVTPAAIINITDETPVIMELENDYEDGQIIIIMMALNYKHKVMKMLLSSH